MSRRALILLSILLCIACRTVRKPPQARVYDPNWKTKVHPEKVAACLQTLGVTSGSASARGVWDSSLTVGQAIACIELVEGKSYDTSFSGWNYFEDPEAVFVGPDSVEQYFIKHVIPSDINMMKCCNEQQKAQLLGMTVNSITIERFGPKGYSTKFTVFHRIGTW